MPMTNGQYVAPTWSNNGQPPLNATELQAMSDTLEIVPTLVRPNLLDNWYFVGGGSQQGGGQFPINQRGQTSYSGGVYTIDRWMFWNSAVTVTINSGGIAVQNASSSTQQFVQYFDSALTAGLAGKTLTLSVLVGADLYSVTGTGGSQTGGTTQFGSIEIGVGNGDLQATQIMVSANTNVSNIKAAKLELGDTQTLAHQENGEWVLNEMPNYQQELEKCQRYQIELVPPGNSAIGCIGGGTPTSSTQCYVFVPTPTELRTFPTLTYAGTWKLVREGTAPASGASVSAMSVINRSANGVTLQITSSGLSTSYRYDLWYTAADATNKLLLSANL